MTLSDMAREIERRRPGTLPCQPSLLLGVPIDLAAAILRDAMVMATGAMRVDKHMGKHLQPSWLVDNDLLRCSWFDDADHGNCPTSSLFAAFCAAFPEVKP